MSEIPTIKKQNDGQLNLYRLMRLQNRENSFTYRDEGLNIQFRVAYQHFPLETVSYNDLLKTFWKFITTHHFKKIDQEEIYKLHYLQHLFNFHNPNPNPQLPNPANLHPNCLASFNNHLNSIIEPSYLSQVEVKNRLTLEDNVWLKRMLAAWGSDLPRKQQKTKQISKPKANISKKAKISKQKSKGYLIRMREEESELNKAISQIDFSKREEAEDDSTERLDIDEEMQRLDRILRKNGAENKILLSTLECRIREEQERMAEQEEREESGEDASCIEWLLHILEEKQIAESVTKVANSERSGGENKFLVHFESAMNIAPHLLTEGELKRINLLRQISLFKFYKTGVKSIYSFACQNYAGLADMHQNRMNLAKYKDKDYLLAMKKGLHLTPELRQELDEFDVCHHCKYIYPASLLTSCKFVSDRQAMPRTSQAETDLHSESNLQRGRISQRFVSKHRNCFSGYAKINEEYVCGRKFCRSCIKDCYGSEWMKNNNGLCPFCLGVCSCTRCLRHEKMSKLKSFFLSLGGDLAQLQEQSQIEKLPIRKDEVSYKLKLKAKKPSKLKTLNGREQAKGKTKLISKQNTRRNINSQSGYALQKRMPRLRYSDCERGDQLMEEDTERWSSTAEKELNSLMGRRTSNRKLQTRFY